jgi:hypothetical protein
MHRQRRLPIGATIILALLVIAPAGAVPVTMSFLGNIGQTRIYQGSVSGLGLTSVNAVTLTDAGVVSGADGVFSGFDLDFVLLDADGNLATTGDQILPSLGTATVIPGTITSPISSIYQPTAAHPGSLFGLHGDATLDAATATIGALDAGYANPLAVDTSHGWVTLGYGGSFSTTFATTSTSPSLYLFVGQVGAATLESFSANVDDTGRGPAIPAPGAVPLCAIGASVVGWLRRRRAV